MFVNYSPNLPRRKALAPSTRELRQLQSVGGPCVSHPGPTPVLGCSGVPCFEHCVTVSPTTAEVIFAQLLQKQRSVHSQLQKEVQVRHPHCHDHLLGLVATACCETPVFAGTLHTFDSPATISGFLLQRRGRYSSGHRWDVSLAAVGCIALFPHLRSRARCGPRACVRAWELEP